MTQFFLIVASVALAALLLVAGLSSIDTAAMTRATVRMQVEGGQAALLRAFDAYRIANGGATPTLATDGSVPAAIAPYLALPPAAPAGLAWSYGVGAAGSYACLSGASVGKAVADGLAAVPDYGRGGRVGVGCDDDGGAAPGALPGPVAFRFTLG